MENNLIRSAEKKGKSLDFKLFESIWAYALLSWLMATIPAVLIVPSLYGGGSIDETTARNAQFMVIGLSSVGGAMIGIVIGLLMMLARLTEQWTLPVIFASFFGGAWGIVIGGIIGFPIFFFGGFILGWMFAVPLGFVGFTLFAVIYEPLAASRGLHWWQIILIQIGVLIALLGVFYLLKFIYTPI